MLDKLLTRINLDKRGVIVLSNLYLLCKKSVENVQNFFISCEIAQKVLDKCNRWIGISSVRQQTIVHHFQIFHLLGFNRNINIVWKGV